MSSKCPLSAKGLTLYYRNVGTIYKIEKLHIRGSGQYVRFFFIGPNYLLLWKVYRCRLCDRLPNQVSWRPPASAIRWIKNDSYMHPPWRHRGRIGWTRFWSILRNDEPGRACNAARRFWGGFMCSSNVRPGGWLVPGLHLCRPIM